MERTVNLLACSCHTCVDSKSLFESESTAFLGLILTLARKWHEGMPTAITEHLRAHESVPQDVLKDASVADTQIVIDSRHVGDG